MIIMSILVITAPQPQPEPVKSAQFVISSWDYPDEYGQGIYGFQFFENSTGSWVAAPFYTDIGAFYFLHSYTTGWALNWSAGVAMKLRVHVTFNQTYVGVSTTEEGQNYLRHSVSVTSPIESVFFQQNFTYYDVTEFGNEPYYYEYEVILEFLPIAGTIYTVSVIYEIYI